MAGGEKEHIGKAHGAAVCDVPRNMAAKVSHDVERAALVNQAQVGHGLKIQEAGRCEMLNVQLAGR